MIYLLSLLINTSLFCVIAGGDYYQPMPSHNKSNKTHFAPNTHEDFFYVPEPAPINLRYYIEEQIKTDNLQQTHPALCYKTPIDACFYHGFTEFVMPLLEKKITVNKKTLEALVSSKTIDVSKKSHYFSLLLRHGAPILNPTVFIDIKLDGASLMLNSTLYLFHKACIAQFFIKIIEELPSEIALNILQLSHPKLFAKETLIEFRHLLTFNKPDKVLACFYKNGRKS